MIAKARQIVNESVKECVLDESKNLLTYAVALLLSNNNPSINESILELLPTILSNLKIYIGYSDEISHCKDFFKDFRFCKLPDSRRHKYTSNVELSCYARKTSIKYRINDGEQYALFITKDDNQDLYSIVKQIACELLHLIRLNNDINYFGTDITITSGFSVESIDRNLLSARSASLRYFEEFYVLWSIEKATALFELLFEDDPEWIKIKSTDKGNQLLDDRIIKFFDTMNKSCYHHEFLEQSYKRIRQCGYIEDERVFGGKLKATCHRLEDIDAKLRMIEDYQISDNDKDLLLRKCIGILSNNYGSGYEKTMAK